MRDAYAGANSGSGPGPLPASPLSRPPVGSRRRSRRRPYEAEAGPRGPVTPTSRPPGGVTASNVRNVTGPRGPAFRKSGVTSPDHVGHGHSRPAGGHVAESRRSRCAAQASDLVTATTASFQRWSRRSRRWSRRSRRWSRLSRRRSRRRRPRPRDTAVTGYCATPDHGGHGGHGADHGGAVRRVAASTRAGGWDKTNEDESYREIRVSPARAELLRFR